MIERPWRDDITAETGRHEYDGTAVDYGMCVDVLVHRHRRALRSADATE